jgi:hypothetical protein
MVYNFESTQVTNNTTNDYNPQVSAFGDVVWENEYSANDTDLHYYDYLGEFRSIAQDATNETNPDISDLGHVVYEYQFSGTDRDIVYYDYFTQETTTIAGTNAYELNPQIDGSNVVYEYEYRPTLIDNTDIYLYNVETDSQTIIANSSRDEYNPQIAGDYVIYESRFSPEDSDLYRYDIATGETISIAAAVNNEGNAEVSEQGHVAYEYQYSGDDFDLRLYNDYSGETLTLANSIYNEINPDIAGNYVSWQAWDGNDWEIYRYDISGNTTVQVTNNDLDDTNASVSDAGFVVYEQEFSASDIDISLYTGESTLSLGTSVYNEVNPEIYGNEVTWQAWDGNDWEIYQASVTEV